MEDILVPIILFLSIFGIFAVYFFTRNKERLALIDKGVDISLITRQANGESPMKYWVIKVGFLMIGIAIGILMGSLATRQGMGEEAYPAMILLFGGLALVASYYAEKKLRKTER